MLCTLPGRLFIDTITIMKKLKTKQVAMEDGTVFTCPISGVCQSVELHKKKKRINKADSSIKREAETIEDIKKRSAKVVKELEEGLTAIQSYPKSVTFFGSARFKKDHKYYKKAQRLGAAVCKLGYAVVTGGGPGIMQAGNHGSYESCGSAVGFNIELPFEQVINPYVTHGVNFHYFFTRKVSLTYSGEVYLYFPGGFGTLDELFEILTLIQTKKIPKVPVILVGKDFWGPMDKFIKKVLLEKFETISKADPNLYTVLDDEEEIIKIIKKAKVRTSK